MRSDEWFVFLEIATPVQCYAKSQTGSVLKPNSLLGDFMDHFNTFILDQFWSKMFHLETQMFVLFYCCKLVVIGAIFTSFGLIITWFKPWPFEYLISLTNLTLYLEGLITPEMET